MATRARPRIEAAQPTVPDAEGFLGDEVLSVPTTAGGTALASVPAGARHVYLQASSFAVIFRPNDTGVGGNPDSTHGVTIAAGAGFDYTGDPAKLKLLGVGGTASVYAMYFGEA